MVTTATATPAPVAEARPVVPWTPPSRCQPTGPATSLKAAFAALPAPAPLGRPAPARVKRGKRLPAARLSVEVMHKPSPHLGLYILPQPRIDLADGWICGIALAFARLSPPDQRSVSLVLGRRAGHPAGPEVAPTADEIGALTAQQAAPARFAGAMLSLLRDADLRAERPARPVDLLRSVAQALPPSDPLGARARLELLEMSSLTEGAALAKVLTPSLAWADAPALLRFAHQVFQGIDGDASFHAAWVGASLADTDAMRADGMLLALRASLDGDPPEVTFVYGDRLATSPGLYEALDEDGRTMLATMLEHDLDLLPETAATRMLRWPAPLLRQILRRPRSPVARYAPLYAHLGEKPPAPRGEDWALDDRVDSLVRDCTYRRLDLKLRFQLEVGVFDGGPPTVAITGSVAPPVARCLTENAAAFFEGATKSVSAAVKVGTWDMG